MVTKWRPTWQQLTVLWDLKKDSDPGTCSARTIETLLKRGLIAGGSSFGYRLTAAGVDELARQNEIAARKTRRAGR